jgi:O-antigen ligase
MRKITFWLSLVMIFIVPWEDMVTVSAIGSLTRLIGLVVAGFWLITILTEGQFRKPHLFHAFALIFFLWNAITYLWSADIGRTLTRIITYGQVFLLLLIVWELFRKQSDLLSGLQAYVLGSYVCIGGSIYNYVHGIVAEQYEVRFAPTGVNADDLAILLLIAIPLAWRLFLDASRKKHRLLTIINICYLPMAVFAILLSGTRASLFAIIPALIFIFWPNRLDISRYLFIAIFLAVSLLVIRSLLPAGIIERLASASSSISSADLGGRFVLWEGAIDVFKAHPLLGSGSGTLTTLIGALAHQTYLSILAETGLVGASIFVCILAIVLNQAARLLKGTSDLWFSVFFVWAIGVLSLSWESTKATWLIFSFIIIEGVAIQEQYRAEMTKSTVSETEKGQMLTNPME